MSQLAVHAFSWGDWPLQSRAKIKSMKLLCSILVIATVAGLVGCGNDDLPPAPIGQFTVLEKLATSFRTLSDTYPQSPAALPAKDRKKFVERVFKLAGFSYTKTLSTLAEQPINAWDKTQSDLIELVLYPSSNLSDGNELKKIYSEQEILYLSKLKTAVNAKQ